MKIAVVSDDGKTISQHFGMAVYYVIYDIKEGRIVGSETKPKAAHPREGAPHSHGHDSSMHNSMLSNVEDCEAIIARGMGWGAYEAIRQSGIRPFITDLVNADDAVDAYIEGTLVDHFERLH